MAIQFFSSVRTLVVWCFLACLGMASIEVFTYFSTHDAVTTLPFADFAQRFSLTFGVLLLATMLTGLVLHFFMVWLGGVRRGMAILFMLMFFVVVDFLLQTIDLVFTYTTRFAAQRALLVWDAFVFAFILSAVTSLVFAKVSRHHTLILNPRWLAVIVFPMVGIAFAMWTKGARFAMVSGAVFWSVCAVAAAVILLMTWQLGKTPRRLGLTLIACAIPALIPLPWALSTPPPTEPAPEAPSTAHHSVKRVILITVDTLRQDALGCYDPKKTSTPHIDQLARDSVLFKNAFSPAPWTCPAIASILTGLPPRVHQFTDPALTLPENIPTLPEYLKKAEYRTAAVGSNCVLLPISRINRGFHTYSWFPYESALARHFDLGLPRWLLRPAVHRASTTALTDLAVEWLKENAQHDFFFWIHYFDPHMPYAPPEEFLSTDPGQRKIGTSFADVDGARTGKAARTEEERAWVRGLYDSEVRYVDAEIGRLLDLLRELDLYDDALIVLTSDHGEEHWDHDGFEHGHTLYNELIHVPLVIKAPDSKERQNVDAFVTTQAIMPTVLDLCQIPPGNPQGLLPPLLSRSRDNQPEQHEQPIYGSAPLFFDRIESVIFDRRKYVKRDVSGHEMLFDLTNDPREQNSLVAQDPENLAKGRQLLDLGIAADNRLREELGIVPDEKDRLSEEELRSLKALGYLQAPNYR